MGIKGLWKYLRDRHPEVFEPVADLAAAYAGQRFAIDTALFTFRTGGEPLVPYFLRQAARLQNQGITPVYLFDGPKSALKAHEHERRHEAMRQAQALHAQRGAIIAELTAAGDDSVAAAQRLMSDGAAAVPQDVRKLLAQSEAADTADTADTTATAAMAVTTVTAGLAIDMASVVGLITERFERDERRYQEGIGATDTQLRELMGAFDAHGIAFIIARGEAEHCGAQLLENNEVDVLVSDDSDAFAFGARVLLRNLNRDGRDGDLIVRLDRVLEAMQITRHQLIDIGILCGCDFTESNGLPSVGPVGAVAAIREFGTIEAFLASPKGRAKLAQIRRKTPEFSMEQFAFADARAMFLDRTPQKVYASRALDPLAGPTPFYQRKTALDLTDTPVPSSEPECTAEAPATVPAAAVESVAVAAVESVAVTEPVTEPVANAGEETASTTAGEESQTVNAASAGSAGDESPTVRATSAASAATVASAVSAANDEGPPAKRVCA